MEITVKLDKGEDPGQAYDLIRRGIKWVLHSKIHHQKFRGWYGNI